MVKERKSGDEEDEGSGESGTANGMRGKWREEEMPFTADSPRRKCSHSKFSDFGTGTWGDGRTGTGRQGRRNRQRRRGGKGITHSRQTGSAAETGSGRKRGTTWTRLPLMTGTAVRDYDSGNAVPAGI